MQEIKVTAQELESDHEYTLLASLIVSQYHLELVEKLKDTKMYKQHFKNGLNIVIQELKRALEHDFPHIWGLDDKNMFSIWDGIVKIMQGIATIKPEYMNVVALLIDKLKEDPEAILTYLDIKVLDSETK